MASDGGGERKDEPTTRDVTAEVDLAIVTASSDISNLFSGLNPFKYRTTIYAVFEFYSLVNHGGAWDIKREASWVDTIGTPYPGFGEEVIMCGQLMTTEDIGNFTYGYLGYLYGFPLYVLNFGSEYAAGFPMTGEAYLNEQYDQVYISLGREFYMKQNRLLFPILLLTIIVVAVAFTICWAQIFVLSPPSYTKVQRSFIKNEDDLLVAKDYLISLEYDIAKITGTNCQVYADGSLIEIDDISVKNSFEILLKDGDYSKILKNGDAILIVKWTRFTDAGCGILYTQNLSECIEDEFLTEVIPLPRDGWYYYVSDFNKWRVGEKATIEMCGYRCVCASGDVRLSNN